MPCLLRPADFSGAIDFTGTWLNTEVLNGPENDVYTFMTKGLEVPMMFVGMMKMGNYGVGDLTHVIKMDGAAPPVHSRHPLQLLSGPIPQDRARSKSR